MGNRIETLGHAAGWTLKTSGKAAKAAAREVIELPGEILRSRGSINVLAGMTVAASAANKGIFDNWVNTALFGMGTALVALGIKRDAEDQQELTQLKIRRLDLEREIFNTVMAAEKEGDEFTIPEEAYSNLKRIVSSHEEKK